jgi:hypothetical protein
VIYNITFYDELHATETVVASDVHLDGDSVLKLDLNKVPATRIVMTMGEGGLTRFKLFGSAAEEQLPAKVVQVIEIRTQSWQKNLLERATVFAHPDASYGDPGLVLRHTREGKVMAGWETCRHSFRHLLGIFPKHHATNYRHRPTR